MDNKQAHGFPSGTEIPFIYVKKRRGAGFWTAIGLAVFFFLCTLFLFILLIGTLAFNNVLVTSSMAKGKKHVSETIVEGSGDSKLAIISIKGILSNEATENLIIEKPSIIEMAKQHLEQAAEDDRVKAVLLEIDSPGGGITASDILYNCIMNFKAETGKPVVAYMRDVAASGGYYISCAADVIAAHPTTITGSIGVIMPLINVADLINRYGIMDNSIASGDMKQIGSPLKEMTSGEADVLKDIIDEMYMQFVTVVSTGRGMEIEAVKKIADGRIYTGKQALENGLIDQLGYLEDAIAAAKKLAGITEATVVRYEKHYGLADIFGLMAAQFSQNKTIQLDISQFQEKNDSKPMYLWTTNSNNQ
ncbi:MAG: signal peptide peptidase SppA [Candidatus Brocadiaceae bacterium]|nr:signal peptide peptidase SppA [Candidatus Brocadiaceae bacterium]